MKRPMFEHNSTVYQYNVSDWETKKSKIKEFIKQGRFKRLENFYSDRGQNYYLNEFLEIFQDELNQFKVELGVTELNVTSVWCVKYDRGDWHVPHTHSASGFSGVLYLDYNDEEHTGTYYLNPITNPITDETDIGCPYVYEGNITIVPSNTMHYTHPNQSDKVRSIIGFDMKFNRRNK